MAGKNYKTEAVVLRSIRFGEADRILHLYTPGHGRVGAIAKGSRKPKSRFGGRLEPCFRLDLILHQGRGDLSTVTGASTIEGYSNLRSSGEGITSGARACDAVLRLLDSPDPNPPVYHLLCRYLELIDQRTDPDAAENQEDGRTATSNLATALSFRLKLALAAGFSPELASCARCGEAEHLTGFSGMAGGVVCTSCEGGSFPISSEAHEFMVTALAMPLSEAPAAPDPALRQVERAITETLEHHAHVHLRAAA